MQLHIKPTRSQQYVHYHSFYPKQNNTSIPYSPYDTIRSSCPLEKDYNTYVSLRYLSWIQTHNRLVCKRTINHLVKLLSVCLKTKWLRVRIRLQSLKLQISCLF